MDDRLHPSRSLPAEPDLAQQAAHPDFSDQRPSADTEYPDTGTAAHAAERLCTDAELVTTLAADGFTGPAYTVFAEDLVNYSLPVMMAMLDSGLIFSKCAQRGIRLPRWPLTPHDREELAIETIARALPSFRQKALVDGGWVPTGGATLNTFFVNFLAHQFANVYREWRRDQGRDTDRYKDIPDTVPALGPGPEALVLLREEIRDGLSGIEERTRVALVLTEDGYDQDEIAEIIGDGATRRSVEGLLRRHRMKISIASDRERR